MDWKELLAQLKAKLTAGEVTLQEVIAALDGDTSAKLELLGKVKQSLGVTEDNQLLETVEQAGKALKESQEAKLGQEVKDAVREKVSGEMAQTLIARMITPKQGQTKETIVGEIDSLLADESIKGMISQMQVGTPSFIGGSAKDNRQPGSASVQTDSVPI